MANLSKKKHGPDAGQNLNVVVALYDKSVAMGKKGENKDKPVAYFPTFGIHPDDPHFKDETNPFLTNEATEIPRDPKNPEKGNRVNHSTMLYPNQLDELKKAAGDNVTPLLDKDGNEVGTVYAVQIDARYLGSDKGYGPNLAKTGKDGADRVAFRPSEHGVDENTMNRFYEEPAALRAERDAAKGAEAEAPAKAEAKPDPKRSAAAKKAAATRKANKAKAEAAVEASSEEPSFG